VTLDIEVSGEGPDIVLLHGWGAGAGAWNDVARQLAPRFRVHNVNLPGYGTVPHVLRHTSNNIAAALAAALPARIAVCGWSLGGHVAMEWALDAPVQVERLVLVASTPRFCRADDWNCAMETSVIDTFRERVSKDPHDALRRFVLLQTQVRESPAPSCRRLLALTDEHDLPSAETLNAGLEILRKTDLRAHLPHITQPVLLLQGEKDGIVPLIAAQYLKGALPQARLDVFRRHRSCTTYCATRSHCRLHHGFLSWNVMAILTSVWYGARSIKRRRPTMPRPSCSTKFVAACCPGSSSSNSLRRPCSMRDAARAM
jgi:pimeloyl-[acyl-carrier protein] methyl ester esterase